MKSAEPPPLCVDQALRDTTCGGLRAAGGDVPCLGGHRNTADFGHKESDRRPGAKSGLAVCSAQCHISRSVVGRVMPIPTARRGGEAPFQAGRGF